MPPNQDLTNSLLSDVLKDDLLDTMQDVQSTITKLIVCVRLATLVTLLHLPAPEEDVLLTQTVAILKLVLLECVKIHVILVHVEIMHTAR